MSESSVTRYRFSAYEEESESTERTWLSVHRITDPAGDYVSHSDYRALEARNAELEKKLKVFTFIAADGKSVEIAMEDVARHYHEHLVRIAELEKR